MKLTWKTLGKILQQLATAAPAVVKAIKPVVRAAKRDTGSPPTPSG